MEKDRSPIEQAQEEHSLAWEMLKELRLTVKRQWMAIAALILALAVTVIGFLIYLAQYDYVSTYEVEASGIYTAVDKSIVTSQDITPETWELFMEWMNSGQSEGASDQGAN